jgi:hypothetical protein
VTAGIRSEPIGSIVLRRIGTRSACSSPPQQVHGNTRDTTLLSPDGFSLDNFYLARCGADEVQLDLLADYQSNIALIGQSTRDQLGHLALAPCQGVYRRGPLWFLSHCFLHCQGFLNGLFQTQTAPGTPGLRKRQGT